MAAVKPQYGLLALWALVRRQWRFFAAAAVSTAVVLFVSILRFGWEHHPDYLTVVSHVSRLGEAYWPNQTWNGFLQRLLGNGVSTHWDPHVYPPYHAGIHLATWLGTLALLATALLWPTRAGRTGGDAPDLAALTLAATMSSPVAWEHHYGVLLPIFALLLPRLLDRPRALAVLGACYAVAASYLHVLSRLSGTVWNPLQSLLLFVAAVVFVLLLREGSVRRS